MAALCILCLCFAGALLYVEERERYGAAAVLKGLASLCFVVLGLWAGPGTRTAGLIMAGLLLGFGGDVLLNLSRLAKDREKAVFLFGIGVFFAGHIAYLTAVLPLSEHPLHVLAAGVLLTAVLMGRILGKVRAERTFRIFGVVYIGAIMILSCAAVGNLIAAPGAFTGLFAAGALLFLSSDIVLILNLFGPETKLSLKILNLTLYYGGQLLIALSLLHLR